MARISREKFLEKQKRAQNVSFVRGYATCLAYFQQGMSLDEVEKLFYDYLDENEKQGMNNEKICLHQSFV